eukprot:6179856-Pleurochrysis_carterae.AAC.7
MEASLTMLMRRLRRIQLAANVKGACASNIFGVSIRVDACAECLRACSTLQVEVVDGVAKDDVSAGLTQARLFEYALIACAATVA